MSKLKHTGTAFLVVGLTALMTMTALTLSLGKSDNTDMVDVRLGNETDRTCPNGYHSGNTFTALSRDGHYVQGYTCVNMFGKIRLISE